MILGVTYCLQKIDYPGGGAVDRRMTSSGGSTIRCAGSPWLDRFLTTRSTARRPICSIGWAITVSGGSVTRARIVSSKLTTEQSSGTRGRARGSPEVRRSPASRCTKQRRGRFLQLQYDFSSAVSVLDLMVTGRHIVGRRPQTEEAAVSTNPLPAHCRLSPVHARRVPPACGDRDEVDAQRPDGPFQVMNPNSLRQVPDCRER